MGAGINDVSGVTGDLDYKRALTGKTTLDVELSRQINAYVYNSGSEIDTIGAIGANWQATYKIDVTLAYNYTYRQLPGQGDSPPGSDRTDRLNYVSLIVDYEALPWLALKPYINYQDRTATNFAGGNFNASVIGAQFTLKLQHGVERPATRSRSRHSRSQWRHGQRTRGGRDTVRQRRPAQRQQLLRLRGVESHILLK